MNKYRVVVPLAAYVTVEVEADNEEDAVDAACDQVSVREVVGDGISSSFFGAQKGQILEVSDDSFDEEPEVYPL